MKNKIKIYKRKTKKKKLDEKLSILMNEVARRKLTKPRGTASAQASGI